MPRQTFSGGRRTQVTPPDRYFCAGPSLLAVGDEPKHLLVQATQAANAFKVAQSAQLQFELIDQPGQVSGHLFITRRLVDRQSPERFDGGQ